MRPRFLALAALALLGAFVGALVAYRGHCDRALMSAAARGDVGAWFRCEFGLDDAAIAAILREQEAFTPLCDAHCRDIREAQAALRALPADASPEVRRAAEALVARRTAFCESERVAHARRLAAIMPADAGARYLDIVLPRLKTLDHAGAPDAAGRR